EVRLEQDTDGVGGAGVLDQAGGRAVAALELVAVHAGAAADAALVGLVTAGDAEGGDDVLLVHVMTVDVVQVAVPGLRGDGKQPHIGELGVSLVHPGDDPGVRDTDGVGVGDGDRALHGARLLDPGNAGHLPVAVQAEEAGRQRVARVALAPRVDGRDAGADVVVLDEGLVADFDPGDVGNGVVRAGGAAVLQADGTSARFAGRSGEMRVALGAHGDQGSLLGAVGRGRFGCFARGAVAPGRCRGDRVRHTAVEPVC